MARIVAFISMSVLVGMAGVCSAQDLPDEKSLYRLSTRYLGQSKTLDAPNRESVYLADTLRQWKFVRARDDLYRITTEFEGVTMCLDVYSNTLQAHLAPCANYSGQFWRISPDGEWFRLSTLFRGPSFCLDVYGNTFQAHIKRCANYTGQFWQLTREEGPKQLAETVLEKRKAKKKKTRTVTSLICLQPVFTEEWKLKSKLLRAPQEADNVAEAIAYLRQRYCRETEEHLVSDRNEHIGDNCYEYSGIFRGQRVYWGQCHE